MSTQIRYKAQIRKAEDLPTILSTKPNWNSIKECQSSVFRSLDINLVAQRRVTLIDAMNSQVNSIISDALQKGILVKNQDGTIAIQSAN
jgi:hypothetical protein